MIDETNCVWLFIVLFTGVLCYAVERTSAERFPDHHPSEHGRSPL
jgi:hypothetical protein